MTFAAVFRSLLVVVAAGCASATEAAPGRTGGLPAPGKVSLSMGKRPAPAFVKLAAQATVPAAPPYDRAADLAARQSEALRELGARTKFETVEEVFLIVAPGARGGLASSIDVTRRALAAYFNGRFSRRPEQAISIYLFPEAAPYNQYCRTRWGQSCDSPYGFYLHGERRIVMNVGPGIGTLTHELVHPLVESDFPDAPDWINEGIASLFEQFSLPRPGEIRGGKNWRHPRLVKAMHGSLRERARANLPALFAMSDEVFRGDDEDLNYASARYFCQWLDEKDLLWPFYQAWRDGYAADPTGEKAFAAVAGRTPAEANADWARWVLRL